MLIPLSPSMKYDAPIICRALSASAGKAETMSVTVLLIDDSKFMRRANELAVTKSGYGVLTAADGEEGLRVAHDKVPDVIVLDMMLPKVSGPQLLQALKQDPRTAGIPVIVLSSL